MVVALVVSQAANGALALVGRSATDALQAAPAAVGRNIVKGSTYNGSAPASGNPKPARAGADEEVGIR